MNQNRMLFEVSWEVCNKVGGIYTVIKSKIKEVKAKFADNYVLVGPLFENNPEIIETDDKQAKNIRTELSKMGFTAKVGRWNAEEKPLVILVGYKNTLDQNKLLYQLWEDYSVDSMSGGWDYIEPVIFSTMAGKVIEAISNLYSDYSIFAQFHEWMCGAGLLYIKKRTPHISLIFTTHATVLGRALSGNGIEIYNVLADIDPHSEASRFHVLAKHSIEKATAREADCFTTVSEITAIEAKHLLGIEPDIVLPNGFSVHQVPAYDQKKEYFQNNRQKLINFAGKFLNKEFSPSETVIISTSGRYEFHNKGINLLLDSLGQFNKEQELPANRQLLVYLFILTGAVDMSREKFSSTKKQENYTVYSQISTHPLWDPNHDPIVNTCKRHNFQNNPQDRINIIFIPVYLNGHDGIFNLDYYEALSGCDLTIYPSYYEPWGYTPLESIAYSIPTVSTDIAGFGRWIISAGRESDGIKIIHRFNREYHDAVLELKGHISHFLNNNLEKNKALKADVRQTALLADWQIFFNHYLAAYEIASKQCRNRLQGQRKEKIVQFEGLEYRGADSQRPRFRQFSVKASIPEALSKLRELAYNLWWSWNLESQEAFSLIDAALFEKAGNNPVALLESINPQRLHALEKNTHYLTQYKSIIAGFENYRQQDKTVIAGLDIFSKAHPIAYFSMEYGLHECLPIYSGGLGILSGDHIKSASDLNLNFIGVGLLYKNGYFKQGISKQGDQKVEYYFNDFSRMPLQELHRTGERVIISVEFPGRKVHARVWEIKVGRVSIYLFDTDIQENSAADRAITAKLYGGGKQVRIEQEILLGIGGIRLLDKLNIKPLVYHLNEGHSAFLIIERLINLISSYNLNLQAAKEVIKASTVFTTHTPVAAGNEVFDAHLVENYLKNYVESHGINWQEIYELGHKSITDTGPYEMTALALKNTYKRNAVSKVHGVISRKMWSGIWSGFLTEEVPISYITNGVHAATWITSEIKRLITKYCSLNLDDDLLNRQEWKKITKIPDEKLWHTHVELKTKLFDYIKEKVSLNWIREGEDPALTDKFLSLLTPAPLTIGFARRFATYKRATLLFKNMDRFKKLVLNPKYPIQFVFAGKAHPNDKAAFELIKEIVQLSKQEEYLGKIIFVEGYNMRLARRMISGVDVWLNNPRRPLEASGTSGQKAGMNGVLNVSVLDGWWDEAYDQTNGWAIGHRTEYKNPETQDRADCDALYDILENEVIPMYYNRNTRGVPENWIKKSKSSMTSIISHYNTHRMLKEYVESMYIPTAKRSLAVSENNFSKAREYTEWKKTVSTCFPSVHIQHIAIEGIDGDILNVGDNLKIYIEVNKGKVNKQEIRAEVLISQNKDEESITFSGIQDSQFEDIEYIPMRLISEKQNILKYECSYTAQKSGKFDYGIRILPHYPGIDDIIDANLVFWA
ncbi:MAG: alpha-glucan family phosphorylase [Spirochaetales bacterium]|nr:alpha-glucan family phosphorylase [Spirochaetales bacterium]